MIFSFTAAVNDTSKRADPVADLDRGQYVPGQIGPSLILNAYNVYPLAHSDGVRRPRFYRQCRTRALEETSSRPLFTALSRNLG